MYRPRPSPDAMAGAKAPTELDARSLRRWPLPQVAPDADKEARGRVLVVAGSREIPGAALLAGTAALRAGAGKLVIATAQSLAAHVAVALPEARVIGLPETAEGAFALDGIARIERAAAEADAALLGPGFMHEEGSVEFVHAMLPLLGRTPVVLDAMAMCACPRVGRFSQPVALTPHAGEMASLRHRSREDVEADPRAAAAAAAAQWNAIVAVKGATTWIAAPDGREWRHSASHAGLATSGSGDVLAGIVTGLAAQGASLDQALAWAVVLHAMAGGVLASKLGPLGYLARELPGEIPALLKKMAR